MELVPVGQPGGKLQKLQAVVAVLNRDYQFSRPGRVNLKLVDDAEIAALNKQYSGHDQPTDVLSFNYSEAKAGPDDKELGDIVVSWPTAQRQAQAAGTAEEDELALLGLHGILHILGFDHQTLADQGRLDQLQKQVLTKAGVSYRGWGEHD